MHFPLHPVNHPMQQWTCFFGRSEVGRHSLPPAICCVGVHGGELSVFNPLAFLLRGDYRNHWVAEEERGKREREREREREEERKAEEARSEKM